VRVGIIDPFVITLLPAVLVALARGASLQVGDILPRHLRITLAQIQRQTLGGLADDLKFPDDRVLDQSTQHERLLINTSEVLGDGFSRIPDVLEISGIGLAITRLHRAPEGRVGFRGASKG
jgi:hypothetical protein